jgi:hypothetical protein
MKKRISILKLNRFVELEMFVTGPADHQQLAAL